jgi:hypothetical protein
MPPAWMACIAQHHAYTEYHMLQTDKGQSKKQSQKDTQLQTMQSKHGSPPASKTIWRDSSW